MLRDMGCWWWWWWWFAVLSAAVASVCGGEVTYDGRSLIINGQRKILFSGSIHYPRSTPEMWPSLISQAKQGGIDVIETYVFWNQHEPKPGQYDFSGRRDIVRFIREVQAQGLYACLRIGPFIQAEWNYGGFPFWLHDVPGIVYRTDNEPFKFYMRNFTTKIVEIMKSENLYASQGGPIILQQIENEYKTVEANFGEDGKRYVLWAANMAVGLETGVPWVMCKQDDAPDPVINSCNGRLCGETFAGPNSPNKPAIWTENWTSSYPLFGEDARPRPVEDIAFHVALFVAKMNGSFINYYMYHGGTNFGRTASAYVQTAYYDEAPLDEYGLIQQPTWGHLKELHAAVKLCSETLLQGAQSNLSLGTKLQEAYVFRGQSGKCAAFLVNNDSRTDVTVVFQNTSYELPRKSISILADCKNEAFNTAKISTQQNTRSIQTVTKFNSTEQWEEYKESIPNFDDTSSRANTLLEHMNTTKDASDYLWYTFRYNNDPSNGQSVLSTNSRAHALHAFVNGRHTGSQHGSSSNLSFSLDNTVSFRAGINNVSLLSVMVGLPDSGGYLERRVAGLRRVRIQSNGSLKDFTNNPWGYQVGLLGEKLQIYTDVGSQKVQWSKFGSSTSGLLTWYKTVFDAPAGNEPVALNLVSMRKGEVWVNGQSIGRYWVSFLTPSGKPSQIWYHIPRSFLKPTGNLLVLLEEETGQPVGISIGKVSIPKICGHVSESHLPPVISRVIYKKHENHHGRRPKVQLRCPSNRNISRILFASFGTPSGDCQSYAVGSCHSSNSRSNVEKACLGKGMCSVPLSYKRFGGDPCPGTPKALLVDVQCT
ncbi:hypothetical protein AAG906_030543 [Vitis piasezkii]